MFQISDMFFLRERKENVMKGGVNSLRRKHGYKHSKSVKVEGSENMCREFCQAHAKGNV